MPPPDGNSVPGPGPGKLSRTLVARRGACLSMAVWDRINQPVRLPDVVTVDWLESLDDEMFAEVLRSNLLPRETASGRLSWEALWRLLQLWPELQADATEVLTGWLTAAEAQVAANPGDRRARRFLDQVLQRRKALELKHGRSGSRAELLAAIEAHRAVTIESRLEPSEADIALWGYLTPRRRPG